MRQNQLQTDYWNRINKVFIYIDENLNTDLSLEKIAEIACFSPFHFHRVFKTITRETLNEYITRRRIEKSALDLIHKEISLSEIFHRYGFNDSSSYSRAFKKFYGMSPTDFRKQNANKFSKIRQLESKNGQAYPDHKKYLRIVTNLKNWIDMNANIEIRETPELNLAGVTHMGITGVENAFDKLLRWANSKDLMRHPETQVGRVFYDSIKVTEADKVRMTVFVTIDESIETEGEVYKLNVNKAKCIVGHFEITPNEFERAWTGLFIWMNENGYKKSMENPFEIYNNDFREHPEGKFIVDLFIPIE